jgi:hypothetical protein
MMDEQRVRLEAWFEGAEATLKINNLGGNVDYRPANPYALTPAAEYTPSLQEMNAVLLSKFSQEEIWRGEKQREDKLAEWFRVEIAQALKIIHELPI